MLKVIIVVIMMRNREKKQDIYELELEKLMNNVYLQSNVTVVLKLSLDFEAGIANP
jgi:hypothetical protein